MIQRTRIFFDTEFIDDGKTIELISIGMVRDDGEELYLESGEINWRNASQWVLENVHPHLTGVQHSRAEIAQQVREFVGPKPEFWAYFAAYDWVVLCQLYGRMLDVPTGWPHFCCDLRQEMWNLPKDLLPEQMVKHNALGDARWVRESWYVVQSLSGLKGHRTL